MEAGRPFAHAEAKPVAAKVMKVRRFKVVDR